MILVVICLIAAARVCAQTDQPVIGDQFERPSLLHPLGTDQFGRDVLARLAEGSQRSLLGAGLATVIAFSFGIIIGVVSGGVGGAYDWLLMRFMDLLLAIPPLFLAMAFAAAVGHGLLPASIGVGIGLIPGFARHTRAVVRSVRTAGYLDAARSMGASNARIAVVHLAPNAMPQVLPFVGILFAWSMLSIGGLEYLGLGGSPSLASWGRMIAEGRSYLWNAPWIALPPGLAIMMTTLLVMELSRPQSRRSKRKMSPEDGDTFP